MKRYYETWDQHQGRAERPPELGAGGRENLYWFRDMIISTKKEDALPFDQEIPSFPSPLLDPDPSIEYQRIQVIPNGFPWQAEYGCQFLLIQTRIVNEKVHDLLLDRMSGLWRDF